MCKLGLIVNNLGPNQLAFCFISSANKFIQRSWNNDIFGFYENPVRPCMPPGFAIMQTQEAYSFDGPLIATSLSSAAKLINFPSASQKYFYIWDLEWVRLRSKNYHSLARIYRHSRLQLIARSESHRQVVADCWNVDVASICDDCDIEQLFNIISQVKGA